MKTAQLSFLLLFIWHSIAYGQHQLEKFTKLKTRRLSWVEISVPKPSSFQCIAKLQDYRFVFTQAYGKLENDLTIDIFKRKKLVQHFVDSPNGCICHCENDEGCLQVADFDGNGLGDLKISIWSGGNGLTGTQCAKIYFLQKSNGIFKKVSFIDYWTEPERDFDGDGVPEIVSVNHVSHQNHSYWVYNLFNFKNNRLVNVNEKANYPILIQHLERPNHRVTNRLTRQQMKTFRLANPDLRLRWK